VSGQRGDRGGADSPVLGAGEGQYHVGLDLVAGEQGVKGGDPDLGITTQEGDAPVEQIRVGEFGEQGQSTAAAGPSSWP
jgi:hypothetical protein